MPNPPNRETSLPNAPGHAASTARGGPGQGGPMVGCDDDLTEIGPSDDTYPKPPTGARPVGP